MVKTTLGTLWPFITCSVRESLPLWWYHYLILMSVGSVHIGLRRIVSNEQLILLSIGVSLMAFGAPSVVTFADSVLDGEDDSHREDLASDF